MFDGELNAAPIFFRHQAEHLPGTVPLRRRTFSNPYSKFDDV